MKVVRWWWYAIINGYTIEEVGDEIYTLVYAAQCQARRRVSVDCISRLVSIATIVKSSKFERPRNKRDNVAFVPGLE